MLGEFAGSTEASEVEVGSVAVEGDGQYLGRSSPKRCEEIERRVWPFRRGPTENYGLEVAGAGRSYKHILGVISTAACSFVRWWTDLPCLLLLQEASAVGSVRGAADLPAIAQSTL